MLQRSANIVELISNTVVIYNGMYDKTFGHFSIVCASKEVIYTTQGNENTCKNLWGIEIADKSYICRANPVNVTKKMVIFITENKIVTAPLT